MAVNDCWGKEVISIRCSHGDIALDQVNKPNPPMLMEASLVKVSGTHTNARQWRERACWVEWIQSKWGGGERGLWRNSVKASSPGPEQALSPTMSCQGQYQGKNE